MGDAFLRFNQDGFANHVVDSAASALSAKEIEAAQERGKTLDHPSFAIGNRFDQPPYVLLPVQKNHRSIAR